MKNLEPTLLELSGMTTAMILDGHLSSERRKGYNFYEHNTSNYHFKVYHYGDNLLFAYSFPEKSVNIANFGEKVLNHVNKYLSDKGFDTKFNDYALKKPTIMDVTTKNYGQNLDFSNIIINLRSTKVICPTPLN